MPRVLHITAAARAPCSRLACHRPGEDEDISAYRIYRTGCSRVKGNNALVKMILLGARHLNTMETISDSVIDRAHVK